MRKTTKHWSFVNWVLHLFNPVMVGLYYKITGREFEAHIRKRIETLEAYGKRLGDSKIVLAPKQQEVYDYAIQCYKFALLHIDFSYNYFLDEQEIGTWEFIKTMDTFDQLDFGTPAIPSKILKPKFH
jgi:hypothetical protein